MGSTSDIRAFFEQCGAVKSITLMYDRISRQSRGFCFVEIPDLADAQAALKLDGAMFCGRPLRINVANGVEGRPLRPRNETEPRWR